MSAGISTNPDNYAPTVVTSSDYYPYGMDRIPVVWEELEYLATFETDNEADEPRLILVLAQH